MKKKCKKELITLLKVYNVTKDTLIHYIQSYPYLFSKVPANLSFCLLLEFFKENKEEILLVLEKLKKEKHKRFELFKYIEKTYMLSFLKKQSVWKISTKTKEKLLPLLTENTNVEDLLKKHDIKDIFYQEYFEEVFRAKSPLKVYPKYIDKKVFSNEIKNRLNLELKNKTYNFDCSDIFEKYEIKSKEFEKEKTEKIKILKSKAAIEDIQQFYIKARNKKRKIIAHLGPTNSGKTYSAIQEFKKAKTGVYLAPLRLLAREIYDSCHNELNISMITGEEIIECENETHVSSTIEMVDLDKEYDIAIIDEIQMISDPQRGAAWSRALMGLNAKIIYILGSTDSKEIVTKIIDKCNDTLEVVEFKRLSKLNKLKEPLFINKLEKGDAVICFSRKDIYKIKELLEDYGYSTAVVYGSLPPTTRLQQAADFNLGKKDILIATNAIGYGLNLNIKRIFFTSLIKYNGYEMEYLSDTLFKQIAGRAGRFGKHESGEFGLLTGFRYESFQNFLYFADSFHKPLQIIEDAYFFPEYEHIKEFSKSQDYKNKLSKIISDYFIYFYDKNGLFEMSDIDDFYENAKLLDKYSTLSLKNKYKLSFAPIAKNTKGCDIFIDIIKYLSNKEPLKEFNKYYFLTGNEDLLTLENMHKDLSLYLWLMFRIKEYKYTKDLMILNEYISVMISSKIEELI